MQRHVSAKTYVLRIGLPRPGVAPRPDGATEVESKFFADDPQPFIVD